MSAWREDPATTVSIQSLLDERHALHESTLQQPAGSGQWTGNFRGARRGHGTDFDDLRHYSPGDELRHVDWNTSARTNVLHTRLYREEREHRVTLITDLRSSLYTGTQELRAVRACQLTARLLWQAIEGGSRACIIVVRDAGINVSEYGSGHRAAINACALLAKCFHDSAQEDDELITLPSTTASEKGTFTTLEHVAHWLIAQRQLHGTVIWVSAFDQLGERFDETMHALSQAAQQIAVHVDDGMLEQGLPAGCYGYRLGKAPDRTYRTITLSRKQAIRLREELHQQKAERTKRFADLLIPLLNSNTGNADIVMTLRQSGHLP